MLTNSKPSNSLLQISSQPSNSYKIYSQSLNDISFDGNGIKSKLLNFSQPCYIVKIDDKIGISNHEIENRQQLISIPPIGLAQLGDRDFLTFHQLKYAYMAGAMAQGIASEELVIALGKNQLLGCFGAGGLSLNRIETAINRIQTALPHGPFAFNLLHSPGNLAKEYSTVELYLKKQITTIEASAFLELTESLVYYRTAGLTLNSLNQIQIKNKIIAKISRPEVAIKFLQPPPFKILKRLLQNNLITEQQANLAAKIPMADDITVEGDSGGHTDNRPLVCLLPSILQLRDEVQAQYGYQSPVRIGVAGGIATPQSALAAFMMGAAYIVTGSINQCCVEAGTSNYTKQLLAQAEMTDVIMAPAADMFEMGVKLQVLKKGTLFPLRSQKLFELYKTYNSIDDIPPQEREKLENQVFRSSLDSIWRETVDYLSQNNPEKLQQAITYPKIKMAAIFGWYLGLSSRWAKSGEKNREIDYQIWCSPAMGSFNSWVKNSYLAELSNRRVVDIAYHIIRGAVFLHRLQSLKIQGLQIPHSHSQYYPE